MYVIFGLRGDDYEALLNMKIWYIIQLLGKNLTEYDGKQDMDLKIDVCSLYLLNISKHHVFTTQYGYLIGSG